jgi:simple sugar transport system permease protein
VISRHLSILFSPLVSILAAFLVGALLMLLFDKDPLVAYAALFKGAFGSPFAISNTVTNSVPLIFTGLTVALGFRAGLFNIGAEGQVLLGALAAAWLGPMTGVPGPVHVALIIVAAGIAGALWALPPAIFKVKTGAHEVITTLMMSFIAIHFVGLILRVFLKDPFSSSGASKDISESAEIATIGEIIPALPPIVGSSHAGIIVALIAAWLIWLLLEKTSWGFEIRSLGANPLAAVTHGVSQGKTITMALLVGGVLAGIAGAIQIMAVQHKLYARSAAGLGFAGIAVALLANNHPLWVIPSAFLFGALQSGAAQMQLAAGVPIELAEAMQGTVVFVVATQALVRVGVRGWRGRAS